MADFGSFIEGASSTSVEDKRIKAPPPAYKCGGKDFAPDLSKPMDAGKPLGTGLGEIFSCKYSPDGELVASACGDGKIRVYNASFWRQSDTLINHADTKHPCTCLRFRPSLMGSDRIVIATNTLGSIKTWDLTSGRLVRDVVQEGSELFSCDYRYDGRMYAFSGRTPSYSIWVRDEATGKEVAALTGSYRAISNDMSDQSADTTPGGHSNRVYAIKWVPDSESLLLSSGWDHTVQLWDLREGRSVRSWLGPAVCGDAIDASTSSGPGLILTGSWRPRDQLQLWDMGSASRLVRSVEWFQEPESQRSGYSNIYTASFSRRSSELFVAAGSGTNEARVFETATGRLLGRLPKADKTINSVDWAPKHPRVVVGSMDGQLAVYEI
eukprot:tig00000849_g4755.t1